MPVKVPVARHWTGVLLVADQAQHLEGEVGHGREDLGEECADGRYAGEDADGDEVLDHICMVQRHRGVEVVPVQCPEHSSCDFPWCR